MNGLHDYSKKEKRAELENQLLPLLEQAGLTSYTIHFLPGAVQKDKLKLVDRLVLKMAEKTSRTEDPTFQAFPETPDFNALERLAETL